MKGLRTFWIPLMVTLGASSAAWGTGVSSTTLRSQIADWSFIQSVGGLQIGKTLQAKQYAWTMELACDLTGHETFTQKPTTVDSGMLIQKTVIATQGNDILISLIISPVVWTTNPDRAKCKTVTIESTPGFHQVYYRDAAGKTYPLHPVEFNKDSEVLNSNPG
jgi:hypothetical protein